MRCLKEAFLKSKPFDPPVETTEPTAPAHFNKGYVWAISLVAALGGLLFGYDWVVVGGAKPFYEPYFGLDDPFLQGWGTSSALIGCLVGALVSGALSDKYGRRRLLILAGALFTVSAVGTGLSNTFFQYNSYRILGGIAIGLASNLSPMYIAEVSPARLRGLFVSVNQLTIVIGVLLAQSANWMISMADPVALPSQPTAEQVLATWSGQYGWRWMFGAEALPALLFFSLMFLVPESPRWLVKNGRSDLAHRVLARIGGKDYADAEVRDIQATISTTETARVRFSDLWEPKLRKILALGVFLAVLQQWCGINVIFYYASDIFQAAGYDVGGVMLNIMITGLVMLAFTFIAIGTVDWIGRKPLMLTGAAGLALTYAVLGFFLRADAAGLPVVLLTVTAIAFYSFTLAPITWVLLSELFPNRIRGAAMSVAVFSLWVGCFTLSFSFPVLNQGFSLEGGLSWGGLGAHGSFWLYGIICTVGLLVLLAFLPETKGKSLEQIERELVD
jgi:MFS transporter, SP family, arabinose:H+ symporter